MINFYYYKNENLTIFLQFNTDVNINLTTIIFVVIFRYWIKKRFTKSTQEKSIIFFNSEFFSFIMPLLKSINLVLCII